MLIKPHGDELINRIATGKRKVDLEKKAQGLYRFRIEDRYISDCEMIANGGFSPLEGFMNKDEAMSVIETMRLPNGLTWAIPIVLPISDKVSKDIQAWDEVALLDSNDRVIAIMRVEEEFNLDLDKYCLAVYGTTDKAHPGVRVVQEAGNRFMSGEIELLNRPIREDIKDSYFIDPVDTRKEFESKGWEKVVAFQTRNPIHRAHEYLIKAAMETLDGVLIHPLVGATKADDVPANIRMQCYEVLIDNYFNKSNTMLSVLPAAMRYAGPREAVHHMLIRKNYGCSHMIIGRDHAGVGDYYGTYDAQELVDSVREEIGIVARKFEHSFFCKKCQGYGSSKTCPHSMEDRIHLSGTAVRAMLRSGQKPPEQFSRPEVANILIDWARQATGIDLLEIVKIAKLAGDATLEVYNSDDFNIKEKGDKSPLTKADKASHNVIVNALEKLTPNIPILSEEGSKIEFKKRSKWDFFWMIDPLDGTKEFIKKNDEFTINIALIHNGKPTLGVIYVPVKREFYISQRNVGAFKLGAEDDITMFKNTAEMLDNGAKLPYVSKGEEDPYIIVASRSHLNDETERFIAQKKKEHDKIEIISAGSSLKLCLVAEGKADVYPRLAPTMEWDTAAGQAIVEAAGKTVSIANTQDAVKYNKEDLLNPHFIVE